MLIDKYLPADYSDDCLKTIDARRQITVDDVFDSIFCNFPWPVRMMLKLRDSLVKPLGLKTEQPIDHRQLFAQCVHLINIGTRYWLNDEDEALIKETNKEFEYQNSLEQLFLATFAAGTEDDGEYLRAVDIMAELRKNKLFNPRRDNDVNRLGRILSKYIPTKRRQNTGWQYLVKRKE